MSTLPQRPLLSLIAAVARNGAIGRDNALVWRDSADQQHFRRVTLGCPVIMGRKTWESLPPRFRPLPGRRNLVVTANPHWRAEGAEAVDSLDAALNRLVGTPKAFVIGGAQLYALALPQADELVLTEIDADFDADSFFPRWDPADFRIESSERRQSADGTGYRFVVRRRLRPIGPALR